MSASEVPGPSRGVCLRTSSAAGARATKSGPNVPTVLIGLWVDGSDVACSPFPTNFGVYVLKVVNTFSLGKRDVK